MKVWVRTRETTGLCAPRLEISVDLAVNKHAFAFFYLLFTIDRLDDFPANIRNDVSTKKLIDLSVFKDGRYKFII